MMRRFRDVRGGTGGVFAVILTIIAKCLWGGMEVSEAKLDLRVINKVYCARPDSLIKGMRGVMPVKAGSGYLIVEGEYGNPGEFIVNGEVRRIDWGWVK